MQPWHSNVLLKQHEEKKSLSFLVHVSSHDNHEDWQEENLMARYWIDDMDNSNNCPFHLSTLARDGTGTKTPTFTTNTTEYLKNVLVLVDLVYH